MYDLPPLTRIETLYSSPSECPPEQSEVVMRTSRVKSGSHPKAVLGGIRRGFLTKSSTRENGLDLTKLNPSPGIENNSLVFKEVQQALNGGIEWITSDLVQAVSESSDLSEAVTNDKFISFLNLARSNPSAARDVLENDPAIMKQFTAFSNLLGNHFQALDEASVTNQSSTSDCDMKLLLADPDVQRLIRSIRAGSKIDVRAVCAVYPELGRKVTALIRTGLLATTT